MPQNSIKRMAFRGPEIEFEFQNFEDIEIKMPILTSTGNELGQALSYLVYGIDIWEQEFEKRSTQGHAMDHEGKLMPLARNQQD